MKRTEARIETFKLVYEYDFHREKTPQQIYEMAVTERELCDDTYIRETFDGVVKNMDQIDEIIKENAIGWKINRISHVALAVTRLAIYEMLYSHDISHAVAINEAVEIAKLYEGKDAASFINGILGSVSKKNPKTDLEPAAEKKEEPSVGEAGE
ncbi:transcription antitermination factor NusB [Feifania hominis]|uniref:Transcription antitermination protein NusB n=1 Tax=Feifania hominis TaxID=2763660 RepID=A0A926DDY0_9FIRM|nr:transcription antitermination factor NusB [Feifania hominis]MBC8535544.1 transcription antitermination factor NusB [Feifania hominis]